MVTSTALGDLYLFSPAENETVTANLFGNV